MAVKRANSCRVSAYIEQCLWLLLLLIYCSTSMPVFSHYSRYQDFWQLHCSDIVLILCFTLLGWNSFFKSNGCFHTCSIVWCCLFLRLEFALLHNHTPVISGVHTSTPSGVAVTLTGRDKLMPVSKAGRVTKVNKQASWVIWFPYIIKLGITEIRWNLAWDSGMSEIWMFHC